MLANRLDSDLCQHNLCSVPVQTLHAQHKFVPLQHVDFSPYSANILSLKCYMVYLLNKFQFGAYI